LGETRLACVGRELTKKFEEVKRGDLKSLHHDFSTRESIKGEFVLVVAGSEYAE
jgi:16S rRNA (cytidine1402-2'-O)-methyltransferase